MMIIDKIIDELEECTANGFAAFPIQMRAFPDVMNALEAGRRI